MSPFYEIIYDYKDVQESLNIIMQDPVLEADTEAPADAPKDTNIKSYENIFEEFLTDNKNIKDYKYIIVIDTKTEVKQ